MKRCSLLFMFLIGCSGAAPTAETIPVPTIEVPSVPLDPDSPEKKISWGTLTPEEVPVILNKQACLILRFKSSCLDQNMIMHQVFLDEELIDKVNNSFYAADFDAVDKRKELSIAEDQFGLILVPDQETLMTIVQPFNSDVSPRFSVEEISVWLLNEMSKPEFASCQR